MMIGARTATWVGLSDSPDPLYVGVTLVGASVENNKGILSGFSPDSYAVLPFLTENWDKEWEAVISATPVRNDVTNGGMGGVGSENGWTPFYFYSGGSFLSYLNNVAWAVDWHYSYKLAENILKVSYDGRSVYSLSEFKEGQFSVKGTYNSSGIVQGGQTIQIGTNRGSSYPFNGTWDLNKCYIVRDGVLYWEGVRGAYRNVNGNDFIRNT